MANETRLEAPWNTYRKMLNALFDGDDEVTVSEISDYGNGYKIDVDVTTHEKAMALRAILADSVVFGNVKMSVCVNDKERGESMADVFRTAFRGNRAVKDVKTIDSLGFARNYVRFYPEVVQFYDDDLSDYSGNYTGLIADVARLIEREDGFADVAVSFCTVDLKENEI